MSFTIFFILLVTTTAFICRRVISLTSFTTTLLLTLFATNLTRTLFLLLFRPFPRTGITRIATCVVITTAGIAFRVYRMVPSSRTRLRAGFVLFFRRIVLFVNSRKGRRRRVPCPSVPVSATPFILIPL